MGGKEGEEVIEERAGAVEAGAGRKKPGDGQRAWGKSGEKNGGDNGVKRTGRRT